MISFDEARARVLEQVHPVTATETIAVGEGLGRVLAETVTAAFPVPNHDNSGMDGYGVRLADLAADQPVTLTVAADIPAGERLERALAPGEAVRIMTGAPVPPGCDCVVMQEVVTRAGDQVTIPPGQKPRQNIRPAGEDIKAGETVFTPGRRLGPADLGLLTSLGLTHVTVHRRLTVALLSTGNEVVACGSPLLPGQVHDSNRASLTAALAALGVTVLDLGLVRDDRDALTAALVRGGREADAVISTGGVSVGDYDLVKEVLGHEGDIHFWKVAMKPGKPQAYGRLGSAEFFGLPGNPVSGMVVFLLIVRPALLRMMGALPEPPRELTVPFRGTLTKRHDRMDFMRGIVHFGAGEPWVTLTGPQGSGLLSSMARANALLLLPAEPVTLGDGDPVRVMLIDYH